MSLPSTPNQQMAENATPMGILVCKDLFFVGGVTATARNLGLTIRVCPGLTPLGKMLADSPQTTVVILDMALLPAADQAAWQALRTLAAPPVLLAAFGSHVDTGRFTAAQAAGFDHVLAKSAFSSRMVELLKSWIPAASEAQNNS